MKTGGGWAGLGAAGRRENQEEKRLPGAWDGEEEGGQLPARPQAPQAGRAAPPARAARPGTPPGHGREAAAGAGGDDGQWPGHRAGPWAVLGASPPPGRLPRQRGRPRAASSHPGPLGAHPGRPLGKGRRRRPGPALRCSPRSSSRLCFRQPHCGSRRPFQPFRWKCRRAGEWRPCSQPEGRGQPPLPGWQEGEEGTGAPLPIGSAPRSFLERQSWRAGVGEASGPAGIGARAWSRFVSLGACCPNAGALQCYRCCEGRLWEQTWAPCYPGAGRARISPSRKVPAWTVPLSNSPVWQSYGLRMAQFRCYLSPVLASSLADADLACLSCRDDSPVLSDTIPGDLLGCH